MKYNYIVLFITLTALVYSCKTKQSVTNRSKIESGISKEQIIEKVQLAQPQFQTANVSKMTASIKSEKLNHSASATCKVHRDSAIHLSILPFMGIELFRLEMTPSMIVVFDKMNRVYYDMTYENLSGKIGVKVDFYDIQALISNQLFCLGKKEVDTKACSIGPVNSNKQLIRYETRQLIQNTAISGNYQIEQVLIKDRDSNYQFITDYEDFTFTDKIYSPKIITIQFLSQLFSATCEFTIQRIEFNKEVKIQPTNPERYTRGIIEDLLFKK